MSDVSIVVPTKAVPQSIWKTSPESEAHWVGSAVWSSHSCSGAAVQDGAVPSVYVAVGGARVEGAEVVSSVEVGSDAGVVVTWSLEVLGVAA